MRSVVRTGISVMGAALFATLALGGAHARALPEGELRNPNPPRNVVANVLGSTLAVSWDAPATGPTPDSYELDFFKGTAPLLNLPVGNVTSTAIAIPPGTTGQFAVEVKAFVGSFPSPPSPRVPFTVGGNCQIPPTPTGLGGSINSGIAELHWNSSPGAINYLLQAGSSPLLADIFDSTVGNTTMVSAPVPLDFEAHVRLFAMGPCGDLSPPTSDFFLQFSLDVQWRDLNGSTRRGMVAQHYPEIARSWFLNPADIHLLARAENK